MLPRYGSTPDSFSERLVRAALAALIAFTASGAAAQEAPDATDRLIKEQEAKKKQKPPPVSMEVHVGLKVGNDSYVREEQATPIRVVLDNNEGAVTGRLELRSAAGFTEMPVDLPRGAHKEYTLFVPLFPDPDRPPELSLYTGRKLLAREKLTVRSPGTVTLVLSCTGDNSGLEFLTDTRRFVFPGEEERKYFVSHQSPQDLPRQWAGYNPADVVAINGRAWTQLDDQQKRAFRMWVEQGGRAVLCGQSTMEWRDAEGLALAGVTPRDLRADSALSCVAPWAGGAYRAAEGTILTVGGPLTPGSELVFSEAELPVIVQRRALLGRVLWIGFDPFTASFREWEGSTAFWRGAMEHLRRGGDTDPVNAVAQVDPAREAANSLPRLPAPPMAAIIAFGVIYALIFGPVNIWILRRMRRTVRSWLFMPALALAMTLVVLGMGQSWGSGRTVLNSVSILQASSGGRTAVEQSLVGLFSPTNRAFNLTIEDAAPTLRDSGGMDPLEMAGSVRLDWPRYQSDGTVEWRDVALQLYSVRVLEERRLRDLAGSVEVTLAPDRTGTVRNGTNLTLKGAYLYSGGEYHWLGDLGPGQQAALKRESWTQRLAHNLQEAPAGELQENQRFREALRLVWREARTLLVNAAGRRDGWVVAECDGFRGALSVEAVPYNNRAGILLVRVPR
jgi:hypothetical protein